MGKIIALALMAFILLSLIGTYVIADSNSQNNTNDDEDENDNTENAVEEKVTICHIPPGNSENAHTIIIRESALQAHLKHGDSEGECDFSDSNEEDEDTDNENDNETEEDNESNESNVNEGEGKEKVTICHIPPGNSENAHTITIAKPALEAHLAHDDSEGECDFSDSEDDENEEDD